MNTCFSCLCALTMGGLWLVTCGAAPAAAQEVIDLSQYDPAVNPSHRSAGRAAAAKVEIHRAQSSRSISRGDDGDSDTDQDLLSSPGAVARASREDADASGPPLPRDSSVNADDGGLPGGPDSDLSPKPVYLAANTAGGKKMSSKPAGSRTEMKLILSLRDLDKLKEAANRAGGDIRISIIPVGITTSDLARRLPELGWFDVTRVGNGGEVLVKSHDVADGAASLAGEIERLKLQRQKLEEEIQKLQNTKMNLSNPAGPVDSPPDLGSALAGQANTGKTPPASQALAPVVSSSKFPATGAPLTDEVAPPSPASSAAGPSGTVPPLPLPYSAKGGDSRTPSEKTKPPAVVTLSPQLQ